MKKANISKIIAMTASKELPKRVVPETSNIKMVVMKLGFIEMKWGKCRIKSNLTESHPFHHVGHTGTYAKSQCNEGKIPPMHKQSTQLHSNHQF